LGGRYGDAPNHPGSSPLQLEFGCWHSISSVAFAVEDGDLQKVYAGLVNQVWSYI